MIRKLPPGYLELLQRKRYSPSTISTNSNYFIQFMDYFHDKNLQHISHQQINNYMLEWMRWNRFFNSQ
jgi:integrase/recombinase XerD